MAQLGWRQVNSTLTRRPPHINKGAGVTALSPHQTGCALCAGRAALPTQCSAVCEWPVRWPLALQLHARSATRVHAEGRGAQPLLCRLHAKRPHSAGLRRATTDCHRHRSHSFTRVGGVQKHQLGLWGGWGLEPRVDGRSRLLGGRCLLGGGLLLRGGLLLGRRLLGGRLLGLGGLGLLGAGGLRAPGSSGSGG